MGCIFLVSSIGQLVQLVSQFNWLVSSIGIAILAFNIKKQLLGHFKFKQAQQISSLNFDNVDFKQSISQLWSMLISQNQIIIKIPKGQEMSSLTTTLLIILTITTTTLSQTTFSVSISSTDINANAAYTYTITFSDTTNRTYLIVTLPPQVTFTNAISVTLSGTVLNSSLFSIYSNSSTNKSVMISQSMKGSAVVVIGNVKNPPSSFQSTSFQIKTNNPVDAVNANTVSPKIFKDYLAGTLQSCTYTFTGTTQQTNSILKVISVLTNPIPIGTNTITIKYPSKWDYSDKSLTYNATLTCSYSTNNISFQSGTCTLDPSFSIFFTFTSNVSIQANTSIIVKIEGVNCPPTDVTLTSSSFEVKTKDNLGRIIDARPLCTISPTTVSSAVGSFSNQNVIISSNYKNPTITFSSTVPVSFQPNDVLEISYQPNLFNCSDSLNIYRKSYFAWNKVSAVADGLRIYSVALSSSNTDINSGIQIQMDCGITAPPSAQPTTFQFLFKRSIYSYLKLTATLIAKSVVFPTNNYLMAVSTDQAVKSATYSVALTLSQNISAVGVILLYFPSTIDFTNFSSSSCSGTKGGSLLSISSCQYINSSFNSYFNVTLSELSSIVQGTSITIQLKDLKNPRQVNIPYNFGVQTYYNKSQSLSLVQSNTSIYTIPTYTTYLSLGLSIAPTSFFVYDTADVSLIYKNQVFLPSGVYFSYSFPNQINDLLFNPALIYINNILTSVSFSSANSSTKTIQFKTSQDISVGSNITIAFKMTTPLNLGTYNYINLIISNDFINYQTCLDYLQLSVTKASPITFTIQNTINFTTGTYDIYKFTMTTFIPHPTSFSLKISYPSDTTYNAAYNNVSNKCNNATFCQSTINNTAPSTLQLLMKNSNNNTNYFVFTLGHFQNIRSIGQGMVWNFSTYNSMGLQIGSGFAAITIINPNLITSQLSKNNRYYNGNNYTAVFYLNFTNALTNTDYFQMQFGSDSYTKNPNISLSCGTNAVCSQSNKSSINILVIEVRLISNLSTKQFTLSIDGLVSSSSARYNQNKYINISSFTSSNLLIDKGYAIYNISCGQHPQNSCKQCLTNGTCLSCYSDFNTNLYNGQCVNNCSTTTSYQNYNSSGSCLPCSNNCKTCINNINCITCITGTVLTYYLYLQNMTCISICNKNGGYYELAVGTALIYCKKCFNFADCLACSSDSINGCTKCRTGVSLQSGECVSGCRDGLYIASSGVCEPCNVACKTCIGGAASNCYACQYPYLNVSGTCVLNCPNGSVANYNTLTCGCNYTSCQTCENYQTYCLTCTVANLLAYQGVCNSTKCPLYSYNSSRMCVSCTSGCINCTATMCLSCDPKYYAFQNKCYSDCNSVARQYDNDDTNKKCILCPQGCDSCSGVVCTSCLSGFRLQGTSCLSQCVIQGNCKPDIPQKILPLPGLISAGVWIILVIVVKLILKKLYTPYSLIIGLCIVQLILIIASIAVLNKSSISSSGRLLIGTDYSYRQFIINLLAAGLAFNYITNILYLIIFVKYVTPLITNPRQIDYIVNIAVLIVCTLTNYRFGLIAFSKMFPKPQIQIDNSSRLTPINYLAVFSVIFDILPLAAAGLMIYKQYPGTNLFMLGIDLLILLIIIVAITVWMVAVPKSQDYYISDIKKFSMQENYRTQQNINDDKNQSYNKLASSVSYPNNLEKIISVNDDMIAQPVDNSTIQALAGGKANIQSEEENAPLPTINKSNHHKIQNIRITGNIDEDIGSESHEIDEVIHFDHSELSNGIKRTDSYAGDDEPLQSKKTKRIQQNSSRYQNSPSKAVEEQNIQRKFREQPSNFSKEKVSKIVSQTIPRKHTESEILQKPIKVKQFDSGISDDLQHSQQIQPIFIKSSQQDLPKRKNNESPINNEQRSKHKPRRKEQQSQPKLMMRKKNEIKVYETDQAENSNKEEEIDLQDILNSKIKQSQSFDRGLKVEEKGRDLTEDISPSWFNVQNQRIDISQIEDIQ